MEKQYRVIFHGTVHEGLDPKHVKQLAGQRLRINPEQLERIFIGRRVILKQHLTAAQGWSYVRALEQLGMVVELESMQTEAATQAATKPLDTVAPPASPSAPQATRILQAVPTLEESQVISPPTEPPPARPKAVDISHFERTHINLARAEALLNGSAASEMPVVSDFAVSEKPSEPKPVPVAPDSTPPMDKVQRELAALEAYLGAHELPPAPTAPLAPASIGAVPLMARQALHGTVNSVTAKHVPLVFSTVIECAHCGTSHVIEGQLMVNVLPQTLHSAKAG